MRVQWRSLGLGDRLLCFYYMGRWQDCCDLLFVGCNRFSSLNKKSSFKTWHSRKCPILSGLLFVALASILVMLWLGSPALYHVVDHAFVVCRGSLFIMISATKCRMWGVFLVRLTFLDSVMYSAPTAWLDFFGNVGILTLCDVFYPVWFHSLFLAMSCVSGNVLVVLCCLEFWLLVAFCITDWNGVSVLPYISVILCLYMSSVLVFKHWWCQ